MLFIMGIKNTPKDAAAATASPTIEPIRSEATMVTMAIAPFRFPNQTFTNLTSVSIPESVTSIGDRAFYSCAALKSVQIPANLSAKIYCSCNL